MYRLFFHPRTEKQLRKLPGSLQKKIIEKIEKLAANPFGKFDIKKLAQTKQSYRLRLGQLRVIYEMDQKQKSIYIHEIGFRGQIY